MSIFDDFIRCMFDSYEDRKVARFERGKVLIDTCSVTDSDKPFETAVAHPFYNNGNIVIVQEYDTKEEAWQGHNNWVSIMTARELPGSLTDVSSIFKGLLESEFPKKIPVI